jgi:hypothetical protein
MFFQGDIPQRPAPTAHQIFVNCPANMLAGLADMGMAINNHHHLTPFNSFIAFAALCSFVILPSYLEGETRLC